MLSLNFLSTIFAFIPFAIFFYLLLFKKLSLLKVSLTTLILATALVVVYWQVFPQFIFYSYVKGILVSLDIFFIIFGAIFLLDILKRTGIIKNIFYYLESISPDYRILVIILAWFFEGFLEGTAGFGTPSTVVAPILVALGLSPISAVVIALLGNSTSVAFGAAGTPTRIGFFGINDPSISIYGSLFNLVGLLVPVAMLWVLVSSQKNRKTQFLEALPFALWSGVAFVVPSLIVSFFGQEFPSILGSIFGFIIILLTTKAKLFIPKNIRRFNNAKTAVANLSLIQVLFPYLILILLLFLGKFFLSQAIITIPFGINHQINLFNPGFAFILTAIFVLVIKHESKNFDFKSVNTAFNQTIKPYLVIAFMSIFTQLMIISSQNSSGHLSIIELIAKIFQSHLLPFFAPFIGAFGSFITGSATVSNLMFGNFLNLTSLSLLINPSIILALELVGASAGNMIALADILTAETVVGLKNQEIRIINKIILPCFIYLLLVATLGLIFIR